MGPGSAGWREPWTKACVQSKGSWAPPKRRGPEAFLVVACLPRSRGHVSNLSAPPPPSPLPPHYSLLALIVSSVSLYFPFLLPRRHRIIAPLGCGARTHSFFLYCSCIWPVRHASLLSTCHIFPLATLVCPRSAASEPETRCCTI